MNDTSLLKAMERFAEKHGWKVELSEGVRQHPDSIRLSFNLRRKSTKIICKRCGSSDVLDIPNGMTKDHEVYVCQGCSDTWQREQY